MMSKIDNKSKPKITKAFGEKLLVDWHLQLPFLYTKKNLSLGKRIGPILISVGFDVKNSKEEYQPGFGVHNLSSPFENLSSTLYAPLRTVRTNAPDALTVRAHERGDYIDAANRMKNQSLLPLDKKLSLSMVVDAYKNFAEKNIHMNIGVSQDPALIAAWAGQDKLANELIEWGLPYFLYLSDSTTDQNFLKGTWYKSMQEKISNPQRLREIAEEQAIFHKVDHIPMEELIID